MEAISGRYCSTDSNKTKFEISSEMFWKTQKIQYNDIVNVTAFNLHVEWTELGYQLLLSERFKQELDFSVNINDRKQRLFAEKDT